jgi:hypothetical protein
MPQAVDNVAFALEQLSEQVRNLERRVAALEGQNEDSSTADFAVGCIALQRPRPPATWSGFPPLEMPSGAVPILGKAVLAIAGAYLLRAVAESTSVPKMPVLALAILYACFWLVWAVRLHHSSRFASAVYAVTSASILSPLLWESSVRFKVLPPVVSAAITVGFVTLAIILAWGEELQFIPWVATLASVTTALSLIIETHDLVPLTAALLGVSTVTEAAACLGHRLTIRAIPALAADFAVWLLVFILASESVPDGYLAAGASTIATLCLLLFVIHAASIGVRSFAMLYPVTAFEIGQAAVAFVLATYGVLHTTHGSFARPLGGSLLLVSAVCYWGALVRFREESQTRNRRVSATWAAVLLISGGALLFTTSLLTLFLALATMLATVFYSRTRKISLGIHTSSYAAASVGVSTLPMYAANALMKDVPGLPDWQVWLVGLTGAVCYMLGSRNAGDQGRRRLLWLVPAAIVTLTAGALAVVAIARLTSIYGEVSASSLSVIRTAAICAIALTLGVLGGHENRAELIWLAYAAVALGTLKLFLEDLRFGNALTLVVSLLFYGLILILLPRLTKRRELAG